MVDKIQLAIGGLATVCVVLLLVLGSIDCIEQNQYGLVYNWVTKAVGDRVYHGGTHLIGFWNTFIIFPATVQTIEFSDRLQLSSSGMLHTRTKEGLGLHLSISFQYRLDHSKLPELYSLTNMKYEGLFVRMARDQLLEAASEYEGPHYWLRRQEIGSHMRELVDKELTPAGAHVWGLQLLAIDLPDKYEHAITMTQVQQQMVRTRLNEQAAASIRADTEVLEAQFRRKVQVVSAGAAANYTRETKLALAEAQMRTLNVEAETLGYVRQKLNLSPADAVRYQEIAAYNELKNATFLSRVPGPLPVVGMAAGAEGTPAAAVSFLEKGSTLLRTQDTGGQSTMLGLRGARIAAHRPLSLPTRAQV